MAPSSQSVVADRLALAALVALVGLAMGLRLVPLLIEPSANWGDEIFQGTEQAHRLVYGTGLVPWEFELGVRSWILPGAITGLMALARMLGEGPDYYLPVIAGAFAALAAAPVICAFLWSRRHFGMPGAIVAGAVVAVAPELVYFGARSLTETVAAHVLVIALCLIEGKSVAAGRARLVAAGVLLGLAFVLRVHLGPAIALLGIWAAARDPRRLLPLAIGGVGSLAFAGLLDWATLGYPFASIWRYTVYNLYYGVSSSFGVEPWTFYMAGEVGLWAGAAAAPFALALLGGRRMPALLAAAAIIMLVHAAVPHKEYRFIYPAVMLLTILAGMGLAEVASWLATRLGGARRRRHVEVGAAALAILWWGVVSYQLWSGDAMRSLRLRAHDELLAAWSVAGAEDVCGIGIYYGGKEDWVYGGYTYFHHPVAMYWPADPAELASAARSFNVLVHTGPVPSELGFASRQCFGKVCVARRAGSCAHAPMKRLPVPDALADFVPKPH